MAAIFDLEEFARLPLWGQVLIAARMVRRGSLALVEGATFANAAQLHAQIMGACDVIEQCARAGEGARKAKKTMTAARQVRDGLTRQAKAVGEALWWAVDAAEAAEAANDFPIDATVTNSARAAIGALATEPRVISLQVTILMAGDIDLVRFSSGEAKIGKYDGLSEYVFERITPVHALTVVEPCLNPQDLAR